RSTWISGPDNAQFGRFWQQCKDDGTFDRFQALTGMAPGPHTQAHVLGVSRVEANPALREFTFMVAVEAPPDSDPRDSDPRDSDPHDLVRISIPACRWAIFEAHGPVPEALVAAEMYAFIEWLPASGLVHAHAPEMEVYPPSPDGQPYCEFWLPVERGSE
ncbi:MAG: GyrI-like domain-containing protein, partial [Anaerolineae bacterium]|nr:GyrI-like domain-containing protein [Anaerolineae bacterium]